MSLPSSSSITVIIPQEGEAWSALAKRMVHTTGDLLLVLSGHEQELMDETTARAELFAACKKIQQRLRIATKHPVIAAEARSHGMRVLDRTKHVKALLQNHHSLNDALRLFSPHLWKQQLTSKLQRMGLLSVPRARIFSLLGLSAFLFFFVVFKLLPSAEIRIKPRQEPVSQTVNIFLVNSGSVAAIPDRVRKMELVPINVKLHKKTTFDYISKEFIGTSSQLQMTVYNKSTEEYSLRIGTRFSNQAGMIFKIVDPAIMGPGEEVTVRARAEDTDLYGQIIGDRGNVPKGLKWEIPGLSAEERLLVYGENKEPGKGGTTAYKTVLRQEDIDLARKRLEQQLLSTAIQTAEKEVQERNRTSGASHRLVLLSTQNYPQLSALTYTGFVLPTSSVGQPVTSVSIEGGINYTVFAYDAQNILNLLRAELESHVREGRRLLANDLTYQDLSSHVIAWDDGLAWIKLTVDLTGAEQYILDPLSPVGAVFAKHVRDQIAGKRVDEALRIIKNMPEVETAEISQWPPWQKSLPGIGAHISIHIES